MKEKLFHEEYEGIEVPRGDLLKSIKTGVQAAYNETSRKKERRVRMIAMSTVAAAFTFISSSFIVPTFSHVLADVPIVGGLYANFNDLVGRNLESQKLITQINETASSRGIDVAVTSSYYDGAVIGVTFDVKGKVKEDRDGNRMAFYEIFNGDERISETKEVVNLQETDEGYSGHIQVSYPYSELPHETTLPLKFMSIGEKEGVWKFDVPIKQLPFALKTLNVESNNEGNLKVKFDSIIIGKASAAIDYTATVPVKDVDVSFDIYDDKGEHIYGTTEENTETLERSNHVNKKGRITFLKELSGRTKYLEIHPNISFFEEDQFVTLDQKSPLEIRSARQELSVKVEKMAVKDNSFVIEFQVNNGKQSDKGFLFFKDFARTSVVLVEESRKEIYEEPIKHTIKVIDKEELRFRSTFDLSEIKKFSKDQFVLRVDLGHLAANMPVKLEPVRIELNKLRTDRS
jgi:hypothetical protein